jgi:hypothetical protein
MSKELDAFEVFYGEWNEDDFRELWSRTDYKPHFSVLKIQERIDKASVVTDEDIERAKKKLEISW